MWRYRISRRWRIVWEVTSQSSVTFSSRRPKILPPIVPPGTRSMTIAILDCLRMCHIMLHRLSLVRALCTSIHIKRLLSSWRVSRAVTHAIILYVTSVTHQSHERRKYLWWRRRYTYGRGSLLRRNIGLLIRYVGLSLRGGCHRRAT